MKYETRDLISVIRVGKQNNSILLNVMTKCLTLIYNFSQRVCKQDLRLLL